MSSISEESKVQPQEKISRFRKVMRVLTAICVWSFLTFLIVLIALFLWIYTGPRSVPLIASYTAKAISDLLPHSSTLSIDDVLIMIDDNNLVLKVKNPIVRDARRGDFELSEVDLRFDVVGLMPQSNRNILSVEISDPKLQLNKLLNAENADDDGDQKLPIEQINSYLNEHKAQLVKFSLSLNNTKFSFNANEDRVVEVVINSLTLAPNIQNGKIVLSLYGDVNIAGNSNVIDLTVDTSNIKYLEFSGAVNNVSTLLFEALGYPIKELSGSNLEVDVNFKGRTNSLRHLEHSEFEVSNFRGKIVKNSYFKEDIIPKSLLAHGEIFDNGSKVIISDIDLVVGSSNVTGKATLKGKKLKSALKITKINVKELSAYWPRNLLSRTRDWIFDSVTTGDITNIKVDLNLDLSNPSFPANLKKDAYNINLDINNATFQLDKNFPIIKEITSNISINSETATIKGKSASVNNVKLSEINGVLNNLGRADSTLKLTSQVTGNTKDVVDLAFLFSQQKNTLFQDVKGNTSADLKLELRIFDEIKSVNDLNMEVVAQINDFSSDKLISAYPINNGKFEAKFKDGIVNINGSISVKQLTDVAVSGWVNILDQSKSIQASKKMNFNELPKIGVSTPNLATGDFDVTIFAEQKIGSKDLDLQIKAIVDESKVKLPQLNVLGKNGKKGIVTLFAKIKNDVFAIHAFDVKFTHLDGVGSIKMNSKNEIIAASSKKMKIGKSEFAFDYKNSKTLTLKINGPSFDYAAFNFSELFKTKGGVNTGAQSSGARSSMPAAKIELSVEKLYLMENQVIYKPKLDFVSSKNTLNTFTFNGYTSVGEPIKIEYFSPRLVANIPNASLILKGVGIYNNMTDGRMFVSGLLDEDGVFRGDLVVTDFRINKAPILAKILSLASVSLTSLTSLGDIIGGKGIKFTKLITKFQYADRIIKIDDLMLKGPSIALTGEGDINFNDDSIYIKGTVVPENIINKAVKKIPILNKLLGSDNKNEEAIGVKYKVKGTVSDPKVKVNPLSILAPGFLKKIIGE